MQHTRGNAAHLRDEAVRRARDIKVSWAGASPKLGSLLALVYDVKACSYLRSDCEVLHLCVYSRTYMFQALGTQRLEGFEKDRHRVIEASSLHATTPQPLKLWRPMRVGDRVPAFFHTAWHPATVSRFLTESTVEVLYKSGNSTSWLPMSHV